MVNIIYTIITRKTLFLYKFASIFMRQSFDIDFVQITILLAIVLVILYFKITFILNLYNYIRYILLF